MSPDWGRCRRILAATAMLCGLAGIAGCGADDGGRPVLKVSAATSLKNAFEDFSAGFQAARASFSFAGSDELAAQINSGLKPDVFAAANTKLPQMLFGNGRVERPAMFASNRLVIAVPSGHHRISSLDDLAHSGVKIAAGSPTVPVGSYAREVIGRLSPAVRRKIEANIRSNEPDVGGVVGKVSQGAVDAGLVYITDVTATGGRLSAIEIPRRLQPPVRYGVAVVKGAPHLRQAREFVAELTGPAGRRALQRAGFALP